MQLQAVTVPVLGGLSLGNPTEKAGPRSPFKGVSLSEYGSEWFWVRLGACLSAVQDRIPPTLQHHDRLLKRRSLLFRKALDCEITMIKLS